MLKANETEIALSRKLSNKVREFAYHGGGIYRLNTVGARLYSFTPFKNNEGKEDFCGGWDWPHTVSDHFSHVYDMNANSFTTTEKYLKNRNR